MDHQKKKEKEKRKKLCPGLDPLLFLIVSHPFAILGEVDGNGLLRFQTTIWLQLGFVHVYAAAHHIPCGVGGVLIPVLGMIARGGVVVGAG